MFIKPCVLGMVLRASAYFVLPRPYEGEALLLFSPFYRWKYWGLKRWSNVSRFTWLQDLEIKPIKTGSMAPGPECYHDLILLPLLTTWMKCTCVFHVCLLHWILSNLRPRDCFSAITVAPLPTQDLVQVRSIVINPETPEKNLPDGLKLLPFILCTSAHWSTPRSKF